MPAYAGRVSLPADPVLDAAMIRALELAAAAGASGEIPVGAVVLNADGRAIGEGANRREATNDPTDHAEVIALRAAAAASGTWNLSGCTLVVSLEPCVMCAGAILQSHVTRVAFGAWDAKAGAAGSLYDVLRDRRLPVRAEVVGGIRADDAATLLRRFFDARR